MYWSCFGTLACPLWKSKVDFRMVDLRKQAHSPVRSLVPTLGMQGLQRALAGRHVKYVSTDLGRAFASPSRRIVLSFQVLQAETCKELRFLLSSVARGALKLGQARAAVCSMLHKLHAASTTN